MRLDVRVQATTNSRLNGKKIIQQRHCGASVVGLSFTLHA